MSQNVSMSGSLNLLSTNSLSVTKINGLLPLGVDKYFVKQRVYETYGDVKLHIYFDYYEIFDFFSSD